MKRNAKHEDYVRVGNGVNHVRTKLSCVSKANQRNEFFSGPFVSVFQTSRHDWGHVTLNLTSVFQTLPSSFRSFLFLFGVYSVWILMGALLYEYDIKD